MGLFDRFRDGLGQGLDSSKQLLQTAKEKTQELEEVTILKLDLKRLDSRINSLIRDLGLKVYSAFIEEGRQSLSTKSQGVKEILQELEALQALREDKEAKLRQDSE